MLHFFFIVGIISILVSGISIGAWVDGDRQRANFYKETGKERRKRTKIGLIAGLIGIVALLISGMIYFGK